MRGRAAEEARVRASSTVHLRPATVCGYSPRLRLDLVVNILTNLAVNNGRIKVFGGKQKRPNIHIDDMADALSVPAAAGRRKIDGKIYNAGYENHSLRRSPRWSRRVVGGDVEIVSSRPTTRSYHVSSEKIRRELGFAPKRTIEDAVRGPGRRLHAGRCPTR